MKDRKIKVDILARVEGEGALYVKVKNGAVKDARFRIYEPPRFFEAFLRGRSFTEAPDITARICGICPVAYQMSAVHAMEDALEVKVTNRVRTLRRLLFCGEWIESHGLHVLMLHAPDFLGYPDAIEMAKDHPDIMKKGLRLKKTGNDIVALLGGREIHPINVRVGGFYRIPEKRELLSLTGDLGRARDAALELVDWTGGFRFPDFEQDYEFVAMSHPDEYPITEGRLVSSSGLDIAVQDYDSHFKEEHIKHSTALHSRSGAFGPYLTGPLARYNLNYDRLSPIARDAAMRAGLEASCHNPFKSIVVRSVEILYACDEALRILNEYEDNDTADAGIPVESKAATGYACTEAPRGVLYHSYRLDDTGMILDARIVPPTSQNQKMIEQDLKKFVSDHLDLPDEKLTWQCEQIIRNYDPCISCATHFLKLDIERE